MPRKINLAVRRLVEFYYQSGDLVSETFGTRQRLAEAARMHRKLQQEKPEGYLAEVYVSHEIEREKYVLKLSGRIDGLFQENSETVIEEIKTTLESLDIIQQGNILPHWAQVKIYACIYARENSLKRVILQLTYYQLETKAILIKRENLGIEELESFFEELLQAYLHFQDIRSSWLEERDRSLLNLAFPFPEYRKGQREMAVRSYRAVASHTQLLIQAATGIGKTMAVLYPVLKALGLNEAEKVFYLTARTTGRDAASQAVGRMREKGLHLRSLILTAKEKICFQEVTDCNPEACLYARNYFDKVKPALLDALQYQELSRAKVEELAEKYQVCPFEFSLLLSLWSDLIICDFNYVFDPRVKLKRFFEDQDNQSERYVFLIDEAHNLVDRARNMYSASLKKSEMLAIRRALPGNLSRIRQSLSAINTWFLQQKKKSREPFPDKEIPEKLLAKLRKFQQQAENWLVLNIHSGFRKQLLELYFEVDNFLKISELYNVEYYTCYFPEKKDLMVKLYCLNPSGRLRESLQKAVATIAFSATLSPLEYHQEVLGFESDAGKISIPSPFPPENMKVMLGHNLSTRWKHRQQTLAELAEYISAFINARKGNYLIFLPSYEYLNALAALFPQQDHDQQILIQNQDMTEADRTEFIAGFGADPGRNQIGFVVMGGVFGEGIDLIGNRLDGAVIVGVGLPGISLERDLLKVYYDEQNKGFAYAYLYPGLIRVLQAAGRVIRSDQDRGAVLLIDDRFISWRYRRMFPACWQPVKVDSVQVLKAELSKFWVDNLSDNY